MTTITREGANGVTASYILRCGRNDCHAWFYPSLFQLKLIQNGSEKTIDLGFAGSRVLERLLREPGKLVSREELLEYGWPQRVVSQGSLNQQIHTLRQYLTDNQERGIIQTIPRRGYLFNAAYCPDAPLQEPVASRAKGREKTKTPAIPVSRASSRRWAPAMVARFAGLLFLMTGLAYTATSLSQIRLISTEVNGGRAFILYVNHKPEKSPQNLVMRRNAQDLAALEYND